MSRFIVGFVLGFIVSTVGIGSLFNFVDNTLQKSQTVLKENVK